MNISRKWLKEFVDITATDKQYDEIMTIAGQKVETTTRMDEDIKNIVCIGKRRRSIIENNFCSHCIRHLLYRKINQPCKLITLYRLCIIIIIKRDAFGQFFNIRFCIFGYACSFKRCNSANRKGCKYENHNQQTRY